MIHGAFWLLVTGFFWYLTLLAYVAGSGEDHG